MVRRRSVCERRGCRRMEESEDSWSWNGSWFLLDIRRSRRAFPLLFLELLTITNTRSRLWQHTAIVVGTGTPSSLPIPSSLSHSPSLYSTASLASLTVVEQSLGQAPSKRTYDLSTFTEGEIWIYRPCGMQELTGVDKVEARWPDEEGVQSWQVGELEWRLHWLCLVHL